MTEGSKPVTNRQTLSDCIDVRHKSSEMPRVRNYGGGGCRGLGEGLFDGHRVSVWEDEKVLATDGGGGCTTM